MRELRVLTLLIGSGAAAQGLMLVGNLLLARLYTPAAFGELGVLASIASWVAVVAGLRFDYVAFAQPEKERAPLFALALVLALCLHALLLSGLAIGTLAGFGSVRGALWLVAFSAAASLYYLATQSLIATGDYSLFARMRLFQALAQIGLGAALVSLEDGMGLLLAFAGSQAVVAALILTRRPALAHLPNREQAKRLFVAHQKLALPNSLLVLLQYATPFAPILLAKLFFSVDEAGAYFLFAAAVAAPLAIFRRSLINLLNGEVASPARAWFLLAALRTSTSRWLVPLTLSGGAMVALALGQFSEPFCALVFGKEWVPHAALLLPLVMFHVLDALLQPFTTLLPLWGRQSWAMGFEALRFGLVFLALPACVALFRWNFHTAVLCYFGFMSLVYLLSFSAVCHQVSRARAEPASGGAA